MFDASIDITSIPPELEMDFSRILNKPFLVTTESWTTATSIYQEVARVSFPEAIMNNYLASVPFNSASKFRAKMCAMLQVSGTPMHQGTLLAAALPHKHPKVQHPTQLLSAPHVFMSANESTSVCLELPFYSNTDVINTPSNNTNSDSNLFPNYVDLVIFVLNKLTPGDGASTDLTISVHAMFNDAQFFTPQTIVKWNAQSAVEQDLPSTSSAESTESVLVSKRCLAKTLLRAIVSSVFSFLSFGVWNSQSFTSKLLRIPTYIFDGLETGARKVTGDLIDVARGGLRALTGFHNPNSPAINSRTLITTRNFHNAVDQPTLFEKLDQHAQFNRIAQTPLFETMTDEMSVTNIISKPAFLGQFVVSAGNKQGDVVMSHPITPYIELSAGSQRFYSPMRLLYESSRYWRGDLELVIQASMTNFQYCKLMVVRNYENNVNILNSHPDFSSVHNLMCETMEFSAGGQTQTIKLPYCSEMNQLPCTKDPSSNAMHHGMVYIYVVQPTTTNGTTPKAIDFNVYMKGTPNTTFYGFAVESIKEVNEEIDYPFITPVVDFKTPIPNDTKAFIEEVSLNIRGKNAFTAQSESAPTTVMVADQDGVVNDEEKVDEQELRCIDFKPMVNIRDYLRRVVPLTAVYYRPPRQQSTPLKTISDIYQFDVANLINGKYSFTNPTTPTWIALHKMFFGSACGYKLKIKVGGASSMTVKYTPPDSVWNEEHKRMTRMVPWIGNLEDQVRALDRESFTAAAISRSHPVIDYQHYVDGNYLTSTNYYGGCHTEFVIPFMNSRRCVSSIADGSQPNYQEACSDLGIITIGVTRVPTTPEQDPYGGVNIQIDGGISDESRLGFQVINRPKEVTNSIELSRSTIGAITDNKQTKTTTVNAPAAYTFNIA